MTNDNYKKKPVASARDRAEPTGPSGYPPSVQALPVPTKRFVMSAVHPTTAARTCKLFFSGQALPVSAYSQDESSRRRVARVRAYPKTAADWLILLSPRCTRETRPLTRLENSVRLAQKTLLDRSRRRCHRILNIRPHPHQSKTHPLQLCPAMRNCLLPLTPLPRPPHTSIHAPQGRTLARTCNTPLNRSVAIARPLPDLNSSPAESCGIASLPATPTRCVASQAALPDPSMP